MGRKYTPSEAHLKAVEQMASKGVSHAKMAKALGIAYSTFRLNSALFDSYIKKGKEAVDQEAVEAEIKLVEDALLKRCLGHEYKETISEYKEGPKGPDGKPTPVLVHQKVTKKFALSSVTAQMYYLGNRTGGKWKSVNHPQNEEGHKTGATREETLDFMNQMSVGKQVGT